MRHNDHQLDVEALDHNERDRAVAALTAALHLQAPRLVLKTETSLDTAFLDDLFAGCSPFAGVLPDAILRQQAVFQRIGHETAFPLAMRRLVIVDGRPVGRVAIDWDARTSHLIDIAILPAMQRQGIGGAIVSAWLSIAREMRVSATLCVRSDSPARALYCRLGLVPTGDEVGQALTLVHNG